MSVEDFAAAGRRGSAPTGDWRDALAKNSEGVPYKNLFNACVALRDHPGLAGKLAYNEFAGCTWVRGPLPWDERANRPWSEFDDLKATEWLQSPDVRIQVGSGTAREAVQSVAYEARFHPVLEWLESLKWDGVERLSDWLSTYLGVPASPLVQAIGRKFPISAVARVMKPGCKADHLLILEGPQGLLKSTAIRTLASDPWFADQIADLGTKDSCQDLRGVWIVELSELSAIRPSEVEKVKAYASRQVDHYRPSYGRRSIDVPRQTVFIGTTNAGEYLSDSTGGRRYWPAICTLIDIETLTRDRAQLWAEAVAAHHAGESWWIDDAELRDAVQQEQEARRIEDPWESVVAAWLDDPKEAPDRDGTRMPFELGKISVIIEDEKVIYVTTSLILEHAICKPTERQTTADQMRVGRILKRLGWRKHHTRAGNMWLSPESEVFTASEPQKGAEGVHADEVFTPGVHAETGGKSHATGGVNTVNTDSRTRSKPNGGQEPDFWVQGVHTGPAAEPDPDDLEFYE